MSPPSSPMFLQVKQSLSCARGLEKQLLSCTYIICVINCCTERDYLVLGLVRYCHLLSYSPWMFSHLQYSHRYICHKLSPTQYSIAAIIQQEKKFSSKLVSILSTLDLPHYVSAVQSYTLANCVQFQAWTECTLHQHHLLSTSESSLCMQGICT